MPDTNNPHRDLDYLLNQMFLDSTTLGVESYLTDAMNRIETSTDKMSLYDFTITEIEAAARWEARRIIECALVSFLDDPCAHLNSFKHLR